MFWFFCRLLGKVVLKSVLTITNGPSVSKGWYRFHKAMQLQGRNQIHSKQIKGHLLFETGSDIKSSGVWCRLQWSSLPPVLQVVDSLDVSPHGTRVGLVQYSSRVRTEFPLNMYHTADEIKAAVMKVKLFFQLRDYRQFHFLKPGIMHEGYSVIPEAKESSSSNEKLVLNSFNSLCAKKLWLGQRTHFKKGFQCKLEVHCMESFQLFDSHCQEFWQKMKRSGFSPIQKTKWSFLFLSSVCLTKICHENGGEPQGCWFRLVNGPQGAVPKMTPAGPLFVNVFLTRWWPWPLTCQPQNVIICSQDHQEVTTKIRMSKIVDGRKQTAWLRV